MGVSPSHGPLELRRLFDMQKIRKGILFLIAAFVVVLLYISANIHGNADRRLEYQGRYYASIDELFEENSEVIGCGPRTTAADLERGYYDAREGMEIVCFSNHEESNNLYRQNQALRDSYELAAETKAKSRK